MHFGVTPCREGGRPATIVRKGITLPPRTAKPPEAARGKSRTRRTGKAAISAVSNPADKGKVEKRAPRPPKGIRIQEAERTRADILKEATREFAERGFHGGRVDDIARRTRTSKRMIYYYYKNKKALYQAVIVNYYQNQRTAEKNLNLDREPPLRALEHLIYFTFDWHLENAADVPLVMEENIHKARNIADIATLAPINSVATSIVDGICRRGIEQGVFRSDIQPLQVYLSIISAVFFNISNQHTIRKVFGHDMSELRAITARREAIAEMILRYVAADPLEVTKRRSLHKRG